VGGIKTIKVDVRLVAATNRDLHAEVAAAQFREDLYYRLNVVPVEMPPLRARAVDLAPLIATLSERIRARRDLPVRLLPETVAALQGYRWPGNVRELENLLERLAIQCAGEPVSVADLPARYQPPGWVAAPLPEQAMSATAADPLAELKSLSDADGSAVEPLPATAPPAATAPPDLDAPVELPDGGMDLREYLENLERRLISKALASAGGTVAQAARLLGLRRTTLVEKLRKYGLTTADLSATGT
jgi:sigma-54 specific flagellar transcriptional regulator A